MLTNPNSSILTFRATCVRKQRYMKGVEGMKNIYVPYQTLLVTVTTALFSISCSTESPTNNEALRSSYSNRDLTLTATLSGDTQMEFMWIDEGSFLIGSPMEERGRSAN